MSQVILKKTSLPTPAADSAEEVNALTLAQAKEALQKAKQESEVIRKDFLESLAKFDVRAKSVRKLLERSWLSYEDEAELSDEQKIELATLRKEVHCNIDLRKLAESCAYW